MSESEVVDILARKFGILLMPGSPFGAPGYMRLSYGNVPSYDAVEKLRSGLKYLTTMRDEAINVDINEC